MTIRLPVCTCCGKTQYPVREICGDCLSDDLKWMDIRAEGELLTLVPLYHSLDEFYQDRLPYVVGTVRLEDGTVLMVHLTDKEIKSGTKVTLCAEEDHRGRTIFTAHRKEETND